MSDDGEPEKRRKKKGLFGRKKKSKYDDDVADAGSFMSMEKSMVADKTMNSETKKSRGLGKRIKRIVGSGRKQRVKKNGRVDQSNVSYLGVDDDEFKNAGPRTALDPDILAAVMEDDPNDSMRSRTQSFQPKGRTASKVDDRIDEEGEFDDEDDMDMMSYGQPENNAEDADMGDLNLPVSLVLLLVDPETLRFELLQLDFETPEAAKVMDVLDQIKDSVTEPVIRKQDFYAVVDRRGNQFSAATSLPKALTNRRRNRDILIGLSRGVSADKCGRLARSILGDAKVIGMVRIAILLMAQNVACLGMCEHRNLRYDCVPS